MTFRLACLLVVVVGCAKLPYEYGHFENTRADHALAVNYGDAHPRLDRLARVVQWPKQLFQRDELSDPGEVSAETVERLADYLEKNSLTDVMVDVSEYQPREQWSRLRHNTNISPGLRYTFGSLGVLRYTLLPDRVFSRNSYYPFTNTMSLNGDEPGLALYEAALAKAVHERTWPGLYAATATLPVLSLGPRIDAASDVLGYAQTEADWKLEKGTYQEVYPRIAGNGGDAASTFVPLWWAGPALSLAGSAAGSVAGKAAIKRREGQLAKKRDAQEQDQRAADAESLAADTLVDPQVRPAGYQSSDPPQASEAGERPES